MRLVIVAILLTVGCVIKTNAEDELPSRIIGGSGPVKIDKNLRRALLKALADLEAESAERKNDDETNAHNYKSTSVEDVSKKDLNKNLGIVQKPIFAFNDFPGDEEIPSEDKLQNSTFQSKKFVVQSAAAMTIEKASKDDAKSFHVQNVIATDKSTLAPFMKIIDAKRQDQPKIVKSLSSTVNKFESITLKPNTQFSEGLTGSASNSLTTANSLVLPKPTVASPTVPAKDRRNATSGTKEKSEEVKIFQAPLVAAFTVQQDELGVPKSVVPIYRSAGDGEALTLQEQLEFKQRLLEKQLAELQQQQHQQTQFLIRQRQLYEQQLRQKQHHLFIQEQARVKQLEEQGRIKRLEDQQRLKQLEEQQLYRFQVQPHNIQQTHGIQQPRKHFYDQTSTVLILQQPVVSPESSNVRLQPSVSLELPNVAIPPPFQPSYQEQFRLQHLRQQQQQQHQQQQHQQQQQQHQHQQHQQQQQRLQQSFGTFSTEFQPPVTSNTRFNRQEALNAIGNFGFNFEQKPSGPARQTFPFNSQIAHRGPTTFVYNPYSHSQYRQSRPPTPAKQIQHLLYQSGIAGDIGNIQGSGGQEDLNIVSKVLALNVGALPGNAIQYSTTRGNAVNTDPTSSA